MEWGILDMDNNYVRVYVPLDSVIDLIMGEPPDAHYPSWYADKIKSLSKSDLAFVSFSEWVDDEDPNSFKCKNCKYKVNRWNNTRYCPNCGARMVGGT